MRVTRTNTWGARATVTMCVMEARATLGGARATVLGCSDGACVDGCAGVRM